MKLSIFFIICTAFVHFCCVISFGQGVANDDFYIVDEHQWIDTYKNDDGVTFWVKVIAPTHGGVCTLCASECQTCPYFNPIGNYTGFDFFTYKYITSPGNPPQPDSNIATVSLLLIGNDDAQNAGSCRLQVPSNVGQPVNVTNGNMWLEQRDYSLPGRGDVIDVNRFYNSIIQTSGLFGFGWSTKYDESLQIYPDNKMIRLNQPDGRAAYFGRMETTNPYTSFSPDVTGQIVQNQNGTYTLTYKDGSVRNFSSGGRLISTADRNGNLTTLTYDSNSRLTGITDSAGRTLTLTPNNSGTTSQISDSLGTIADYEYYPATTLLKTVTYADGSKYKFEYTNIVIDGQTKTFLTTVKDALDNILETHAYDNQGRATTSEKQGGAEKYTLTYTVDGLNYPTTVVTDALGHSTQYHTYRKYGTNLVFRTDGVCSCGGGGSEVTIYEYDDRLNYVKKTDALSNQTIYTYDSNRNLLTETDPLGTQKWTYNSLGEVLTYKDRVDSPGTNNTLANTYDANGNLLTAKDALNNTTTLTYTPLGQPTTIKDALNHTTTLTWDTQGRLTQVKDANNKNTNFAYDARARLTGSTDAVNQTTNFEYGLNNRLKKVIYPDANFMAYTYDLAGRRTGMTDARNNTTIYGYDGAYRLTGITDPLSHATSFGYDLMSNRTSQTDALGNATNYEYDDFNRLKKVVYPLSASGATRLEESVTYDKLGSVKTRVDTAGRTTSYDYDTANRLIKITDPLTQITQFEYNTRSQMTKVTDALSQQYGFTYDPLGRQLSQTRAGSAMSFGYDAVGNRTTRTDYLGRQTGYEYDVLNRLKKINYLAGAGNPVAVQTATYNYDDLSRLTSAINENGTVAFTYDNRNRVKTTTDIFGHLVEYGYDANSNRTQLKLDSAVQTTYAYDAANRLSTLTDESSQNFTYGYDIANRLISKAMPNGISSTFDYDGMSRLTRLRNQSGATLTDNQFTYNPANQIGQIAELSQTKAFTYDNIDRLTGMTNGTANESYTFDGVGNRTASHRSASYNYQPFNKLTSTATATMQYDANGNMLQKSEGSNFWRYSWDYENRLTQASTRKQSVRYRYDALGRRVQRHIPGLRESTKFTYDGLDVVMDDDVNTGITNYQNGLGIDSKLKLANGGVSKYFLQDHLGSTVGLADSNGSVVSSASYDSFGNSTNNLTTRYQYTGREFDSFTGLQYSRARWYDPNLGRFISEDPIGFEGGDINLFGYVWNSPLKYSDPTGLDGWGNDTADYFDERIEYARQYYQGDAQNWGQNGTVDTIADLARIAVDPLRTGNGVGHAIYDEDDNIYGRAANVAMDIQRAAAIFSALAGPASRFTSCPIRTGNPFKGKTPGEIDEMFRNKGFDLRGPDPLNGEGNYVNPRTQRGYHIDAGHGPPKGPHVGVHRPRGLRGTRKAKDFGL